MQTTSDTDEFKKKEFKNSQELVKQITLLTKRFTDKGKSSIGDKPKSSIGESLKDYFSPAATSIKKLSTKEGILDSLSAASGGGIMSTILSGAAAGIRERSAAKAKKAEWSSAYLTGTDKGRASVQELGMETAAKKAAQKYEAKLRIEESIRVDEAKQSALKRSGIEGADLDQSGLKRLADNKENLKRLVADKPTKNSQTKTPIPVSPQKTTDNSLGNKLFDVTKDEVNKSFPEYAQNQDFMDGIKSGMEEELLKLNEEQLVQLKKLVAGVTQTEEDKFEAKKDPAEETKPKKDKAEDKSKGLMESLLDKMGGGSILNKGKKLLGLINPVTKVLAAGAAGVAAGTAINAGYEKLTGSTIGSDIYSSAQNVKGWLGIESDAEKLNKSMAIEKVSLGKSKLERGEPISRDLAEALKTAGVDISSAKIIEPGVPPKKLSTPSVEASKNKMQTKTNQLAEVTVNADKAKTAEVINTSNNSTVVNNSTTRIERPAIRSTEPTLNRSLSRPFN